MRRHASGDVVVEWSPNGGFSLRATTGVVEVTDRPPVSATKKNPTTNVGEIHLFFLFGFSAPHGCCMNIVSCV